MNRFNNRKAHTLIEIMFACVITVILTTSTLGAFILTKQIYVSSIAQSNFQKDADIIVENIIKGKREPGTSYQGRYCISEAVSCTYNPQNVSELHFAGIDGVDRWYRLNDSGTSILYHHPGISGTQDEVIYTAPQGASLTLRFWQFPGEAYDKVATCVYVAISQNMFGKNISGSATTMVTIRNH